MLKLLLLLCVLFILNAAWIVGRKMYKAQRHLAHKCLKTGTDFEHYRARSHRARAAGVSSGCI